MLFKRFYDTQLAQASYLIGCQRTGEAIVVDPNRDVEQYVRGAATEGVRVSHVTETHIHADFVSGARELAVRADARLLLSGEGGAEWSYGYAAAAGARLLRDKFAVMIGDVRLEVLHTPGHTPEHLSFLVTDTAASAAPWGVLTGDFVFVGDVGRPDLLERAVGVAGTMEAGARTLFRSLRRFRELPDHAQLWPGHGAGSACGKALGAVASSTVGYEKLANWALQITEESRFVAEVLSDQPDPPPYFARMKRINRDGPGLLGGFRRPPGLAASKLGEVARDGGALLVDTRAPSSFAAGHVPGALNIPRNASFLTWVGWMVPDDRDVYLIVDDASATGPAGVDGAVRDLALIGIERVAGYADAEDVREWGASVGQLATVAETNPAEVAARLERGEVSVVDVRRREEWEAGHLPGVQHIPLAELPRRIAELPAGKPVVVHCQGGSRSSIGASVLQAHGVRDVANMTGGFSAWQRGGGAVERGGGTPAVAAER